MEEERFDPARYPKTFAYVLERVVPTVRCNRCLSTVLAYASEEEKPAGALRGRCRYQCMGCDSDLAEEETHAGADLSGEELNALCSDALILCLDEETKG